MEKYDLIIVGAGPAGIFTAVELLRHGSKKKMLLVEKGKPVVMAQVGLQFTQTPVLSLGQWRFSTGLPFSTSKILWGVLLLRSSSSAVKMPAGPAPTMIRSYMDRGSLL